jgi:GNAT superfamily N-acetyltransferase
LQKARGSGVFAALMSEVEKYARAQRVKALSVCTFPEKFEKMFAILQKQGWEGVEWREEHHKVLMMKRLEES